MGPRCRVVVIRHERQYVSAGLLIVVVSLLAAGAAAAQPAAQEQALSPRWFAEGAIVLWGSAGAPKDPEGPGYLTPYFHGAVDRPSVGGLAGVGVLLTRRWSVGAELAAHWPTSGVITEDSRTHSEQTTVTSTYRVQQTVVSLVAGWDAAPAKTVTVRPVLGMTVSRSRQSLTERGGQYHLVRRDPAGVQTGRLVLTCSCRGNDRCGSAVALQRIALGDGARARSLDPEAGERRGVSRRAGDGPPRRVRRGGTALGALGLCSRIHPHLEGKTGWRIGFPRSLYPMSRHRCSWPPSACSS